MKKCTLHGVAIAAIVGLVLAVHAQDSIDQSQYPTILAQPVDACVQIGTPVTFSVQATNADSYQWYKNNTALDGQTNSSLTIASAGISDVGYYFTSVIKGSEAVPTRLACLNVYTTSTALASPAGRSAKMSSMGTFGALDMSGGGPIVVYGAPIVSGGGTGDCPGHYLGYVNYTKTVSQGWGWAPTAGADALSASDQNRSDTKIYYTGKRSDVNCNPTAVSIPVPAISTVYRFSIFFTNNVPTNAYPITLTGFDP